MKPLAKLGEKFSELAKKLSKKFKPKKRKKTKVGGSGKGDIGPKTGDKVFKTEHKDGADGDNYTLQKDGKPLGAKEGIMPGSSDGMKSLPEEHDQRVKEGWPELNAGGRSTYDTFTHAEAVEYPEGTVLYRIVDEKASNNGGFWVEKLPENKAAWRSDSAVKDSWNDNGYYVEHEVGPEGLKAWKGPAAGQQYESHAGSNFYLEGGGDQVFVTPGSVTSSDPKLTGW